MQTFELDEASYMSLFIALNQIRETQAIYEGDRCIECGLVRSGVEQAGRLSDCSI